MIPRKSLFHAGSAALMMFAALAAHAETFTVQLKTLERTPMVGETFEFYVVAPYTPLAVATTDADGNVTFTDNVFGGQYRCYLIRGKSGWSFKGTGVNDTAPTVGVSGNANPYCGNNFFVGTTYSWGEREMSGNINIIGGQRGYVNPNRNEKAIIIIIPYVADTVTIKIYSSRGKLVAAKSKAILPRIKNEIEWDGRNSDGKLVSSGIYVAHISGAGIKENRKIAIVRN